MAPIEPLILHIDIDAFFASVEQLLIPALRGRPVIVGSGVIASCSYEARAFGLRAAMGLHEAKKLCPQVVILAGDYPIYRCFAEHVWDVGRRFTCGLETFLDEAYGDATGIFSYGDPPSLGQALREAVRREVGLPVSVGLAANRMMAKLAAAAAKPPSNGGLRVLDCGLERPRPPLPAAAPWRVNPKSEIQNAKCEMNGAGVVWIAPGREEAFLAPLPIRKLPGVGPRTERKFLDMNLRTIGQLHEVPRAALAAMLGRRGEELYERCRGRECGAAFGMACGRGGARPPRSISRQTTFHRPTCDEHEIRGMIFYLLERAMRTAREAGLLVGTIALSIRYDDWKELAAARTLPDPTQADAETLAAADQLLRQLHRRRVALRHLGVELTNFTPVAALPLLLESPRQERQRHLAGALDEIRDRFGHAAVVTGPSLDLLGRLRQNDYGFVLRTPSLTK